LARRLLAEWERPDVGSVASLQSRDSVDHARALFAFCEKPDQRRIAALRSMRARAVRAQNTDMLSDLALAELAIVDSDGPEESEGRSIQLLLDILQRSGSLSHPARFRARVIITALRLSRLGNSLGCPYRELVLPVRALPTKDARTLPKSVIPNLKLVLTKATVAVKNLQGYTTKLDYRNASTHYSELVQLFRKRLEELAQVYETTDPSVESSGS
jgi:hypothetical protein